MLSSRLFNKPTHSNATQKWKIHNCRFIGSCNLQLCSVMYKQQSEYHWSFVFSFSGPCEFECYLSNSCVVYFTYYNWCRHKNSTRQRQCHISKNAPGLWDTITLLKTLVFKTCFWLINTVFMGTSLILLAPPSHFPALVLLPGQLSESALTKVFTSDLNVDVHYHYHWCPLPLPLPFNAGK